MSSTKHSTKHSAESQALSTKRVIEPSADTLAKSEQPSSELKTVVPDQAEATPIELSLSAVQATADSDADTLAKEYFKDFSRGYGLRVQHLRSVAVNAVGANRNGALQKYSALPEEIRTERANQLRSNAGLPSIEEDTQKKLEALTAWAKDQQLVGL